MSQKLVTEEQKLIDTGPPSKRLVTESERPRSPRDANENDLLVLGTPQGNRKINLDDDKRTDEAALSDGSPPIIKYVVKEVKTPRNKDSSGTEILQAKKSKAKIKKQLTDSEVNLGKLTQTNIQMRGTQIITTKNQIKIIAKDQIAKASSLRKTLRLIIFISAFAVTILLMTLSYFLFSRKGSFNISSQLPLVLTLDQCNLVMYDKGSQDGDISISYRIPGIYSKAKWTTNTTDEFLFSNHILNEQCFIDMYIDTTKILPQLTINCLSACNITQNSTLLTIQNDLSINGITIYANFKDLKADSFNFNATKGYLQLNHIVLTGSSDNSISLNGDIIIQSSQSFSVAAQTDTQAFCFAAPVVTPLSVTDCALSGDNSTNSSANSTTCNIVYNLCVDGGCSGSLTKFKVFSTKGNFYANVIPGAGHPILGTYNVTKGQIFDNGIQLDEETMHQIDLFNSKAADSSQEDPRMTFSIGSSSSKSSASSRWAMTANPAYTFMKPWWIGAFTSSILNSRPVEFEGYLLPGLCPFYNVYSRTDLYEIQSLIKSKISSTITITSLIRHPLLDLPPVDHVESSGVFKIPDSRPFYKKDNWYTLIKEENNDIALDDNDLTKSPALTGAIVLSFIISFIFTLIVRGILVNALSSTYKDAWKLTKQLDNYSIIEQKKTGINQQESTAIPIKKKKIALSNGDSNNPRESEESVFSLIFNPPHLMEYIDFLFVLMFYRTYNNSVKSFYNLLLRPIDEEVNDEEVIKNQRDSAFGNEIKILYEKFCFLNGYCERRLTDQANLCLLSDYGYQIKNSEKMIDVLVKINIKNYDDFFVHIPENGVLNSLNLYMEVNVERTAFLEDQIKIEDFINAYNRFCEYNRLTPIENITPSYLLENFNLETQSVNEQILCRLTEDDNILIRADEGDEENKTQVMEMRFKSKTYNSRLSVDGKPKKCYKLRTCCKKKKKKKIFVIDTSRMEDHFKLLTTSLQDMPQNRLERAKIDLILNPLWQFEDFFSVVGHIFFMLIFTVPLIILMVLTEAQYTPWSQENPKMLMNLSDLERNPYGIFDKILYNGFVINYGILIIIFIFFATVVLDTVIYYSQMEFPLNKFFDKHSKMANSSTFFYRLTYPIRVIPWLCFFLIILFIFGYVFLLAVWLLLGAIIKPEIYLPYASAAITFIIFVKTKFSAFKSAIIDGETSLKQYLSENYGETLNNVLQKFSGSFIEMSKDVLKSSYIKTLAADVTKSGLMSPEDLDRFQANIEESASNYIVGTIKDPKTFVTGVEGIVQNLRLDTTVKIKESCVKRGIPPSYVDLLGAISRKNVPEKIKHLREILKDCIDDPTEIDLVIELLFPESNPTEEYGILLAKKTINLLLKKRLNKEDPQACILTSFICNYKNIQDKHYLKFLKQFKSDLGSINKKEISELLDMWAPAVLMAIELCDDSPKPWKVANYILELVNNTIGGDIVKFLKYYQVLGAGGENIYDLCTVEYQNINDIYGIILDFWNYLSDKKIFGPMKKESKNFYANLIFLMVGSARGELSKIPWKPTRDISQKFGISELENFLPFCLKFTSTVHHSSQSNVNRFKTSFNKYYTGKKPEDLKEFIRLICFYYVEPSSFDASITKNPYLIKLAKTINFSPQELLGLIDYLYRHHGSPYIECLLKSLLERRGISLQKLSVLQALIDIYLAPEEKILLKAAKVLELKHVCVLLVGREMLNPKYLPDALAKLLIQSESLKRQRETVWDNKENLATWKSQVKREIDSGHSKDTKDGWLWSFYLSEEKLNYTKTQLQEHIKAMTNRPYNQLRDDIGSKELEFLWNFMKNIGDLRLSKEKEKLKELTRENITTVENIAKILKISANNLQSILSLFLEYDTTKIVKFLTNFFEDEELKKEELKRIFDTGNKYSYLSRMSKIYLTKNLPDILKFDKEAKLSTPSSFLESILTSNKQPKINDLLDVVQLVLTKTSGLKPEEIHDCRFFILMIAMFAREVLPVNDLTELFNCKDPAFLQLSKLVTLGKINQPAQITGLTGMIPEGNPIKVLLALYGIITRRNFKIVRKFANRKAEEISQRQYLSDYLNIFPEFLILFEIAHEKDLKNFLSHSKTFMTRMNSNRRSKIDIEQIQSLITLIQGDQHNYSLIAQKLGIPSDHVYFILTLMKIGRGDKTEVKNLGTMFSHKARLTQLSIKHSELNSLYQLVGNEFKSVEIMNEIISSLNLKKSIDIELLRGLQHLSSGNFSKLKTECSTFLSMLGLEQDSALFLSALANGNYNIIMQESQFLDWMFPNDPSSKAIKLATFLCAMVNSKADVKNYSSNPSIHNIIDPAFDINPFWMSAFLFECNTYKACEGKSIFPQTLMVIVLNFLGFPDQLRDIFTLIEWNHTLRLQDENQEESEKKKDIEAFKFIDETKDLIKLVNGPMIKAPRFNPGLGGPDQPANTIFDINIRKKILSDLKGDDQNQNQDNPNDPFYTSSRREKMENWMAKNFKIDFEELQKIVESLGLDKYKCINTYFKSAESVYRSINEVLLNCIATIGLSARAENFKNDMQEQMHIPSTEFVDKLIQKVLDPKKKERVRGIIYIEFILYCYNQVLKISGAETKSTGFAFTDLSIMSGLTRLRFDNSLKSDYLRLVYNVHQVAMNIERKYVLEEFYLDVNKFNNIKLMGASLGIPLSNVIEFSLPSSLIQDEFLWKMRKNDDDLMRIEFKNDFRKTLIDDNSDVLIGDLGDLGGTLKNYKENYKGMMDGDWDVIKLIMDLKKKYYGSPYGYNFFTYGGDVNDPLFNYSSLKRNNQEYLALFGQSHLWADQSKIYLSKSILRMVYNKEGEFTCPRVQRLRFMNEKYDPAPEHLSKDPFKKESSISSIKMVDMGVSQTRNRASSNYLANLMQIKEVIEDDNLQISKEYIPADQGKMVRSNTILIEKYQGKKKKGNKDKKKKGSILKASSKKLPQQSQEGNPFGQTGDILSINDVVPSLKDPTDPDIVPEIAEEEPEEFTIQDKIAQEEEAGLLVQFRVSEAHAHELEINVDSLIAAIDKTCDNISNTSTNSKAEIEEYQTEIKDMKEKLLRAIEEKDVHIKNCEVIYGKLSTVRKRMYADKPQAELERVRDLIVNKGLMIAETLRVEMAKLENVFWDMKCSEEKNFLAIRLKWLRRMIRGARKLLSEVCQCPTKDLIPAEKEYELSMISEILPQKLNSMVEKEATLEEKALKVSNLAEKKVFQDQLHDYRLMLDHIYFTCFRSNRKSRLSKRPYFSMKPDVNTTESDKMDITMDEEGPYVIDHDAIFHNLHCLRTNQTYVNLKRKSLEFEMNLMNPNMFMIQKMITGDEKVLNRSDNAIGKRGRQVAETYLALVKLQKVDVKERDFKDTMKHSLSNLQIDSDVNNIGDIISYFLTQDVTHLFEIGALFDIKQPIMEILFIGNELEKDEDNKFTKESLIDCVTQLKEILTLDEDEETILKQMLLMFNRCDFDWTILIPGFLKRTTTTEQKDAVGYLVSNFINCENVKLLESTDVPNKRKAVKDLIQKVLGPIFPLDERKAENLSIEFQLLIDKISRHSPVIYETMKTDEGKAATRSLWLAAGVAPESLEKVSRIFHLQNLFSPDTLTYIMNKDDYEKEISEQSDNINLIFIFFGQTISNPEVQRRLCKLLLGVMCWNPGVMLKSMLTPSTIEDVYALFSISRVFKYQKLLCSNKDIALYPSMRVLFAIISNKFMSNKNQDVGHTVRVMLEQELDCVGADPADVIKAIEVKIEEFEKAFNTIQDHPYEYMNLVVNGFEKPFDPSIQNVDDILSYLFYVFFESIFDGSFISKYLEGLKVESEGSTDFKRLINNSIKFSIKMFKWKNGEQVFPPECTSLIQEILEIVTTNQRERSILNEVISIITSILLLKKVSVKTSEIMELILHLIVEFNPPNLEDSDSKEDFQYMIIALLNLFPGMSLTAGTKELSFMKNEGKDKSTDVKKTERLESYYGGILLKFFPQLIETTDFEDYKKIYRLTSILRTDFVESLQNSERKKEIIRDIEKEMKSLKVLTLPLEKLLLFVEGDISQLEIIATLHKSIPNENVEASIDYLKTIHKSYNLKFWSRLEYVTNTLKNNTAAPTDDDKWAQIAKNIKEGNATNKELFYFADQLGNKDGTINQEEFKMLASRLEIQLTEHRIQEIFAKIKGKSINGESNDTLDEKEFEKAMEYLQDKNVTQGLQLLGINSERLYSMLIGLVVLLLLIFLFIFFGIRSFALGGTFGSIINSFFPAVGALGLGKQSPKPEQSLDEENIQEIGDKTKEITGSTQL